MYYVTRSKTLGPHGVLTIVGAWSSEQYRHQEEIDNDDLELEAYLNRTPLSRMLRQVGATVDDIAQLAAGGGGMFVIRNEDGKIIGASRSRQHDGQELSPSGASDLQDFLAQVAT